MTTDKDPYAENWGAWIDQWHEDMPVADRAPETQDNNGEEEPEKKQSPRRKQIITMTAALGGLVLVGGIAAAALVNAFGGSNEPAPEPVAEEPTSTTVEATSEEPEPMTCNVEETEGKLVTNHGGEITSPETLVAEFQSRYFDDRDGEAVAELWDDGYSAEGFQQTIDESLKTAPSNLEWCLTVMPGDTGWWATEISWWGEGDTEPEETWIGNYKIEKRGQDWIFTDTAIE